jgi:hypothetical protein
MEKDKRLLSGVLMSNSKEQKERERFISSALRSYTLGQQIFKKLIFNQMGVREVKNGELSAVDMIIIAF